MIKGKLTGLRAVELDDLPLLRDWRNIVEFRNNFREHRELSLENQKLWYQKHVVNHPDNFMFIIERLFDGKAIGAAGLLYTNWVARYADFSFYIGENEEYIDSDGYALDTCRLLIHYGFNTLNLNKVWMELYEFDKKKIDFFTSEFAFKKDGILRQNCYSDGKYWNSLVISLLKEDYNK